MHRTIPLVASGTPAAPFGATVSPPCPVGRRWEIDSVTVKIPNWLKGVVIAVLMVEGDDFVASQQGQNDTATGIGFRVYASQTLRVEWRAMPGVTFTGPLLLASAVIELEQVDVNAK